MAQLNAMRKITAEKLGIDVTKPVTGAGFVKNPEYNPNDALSKRYVPSGQPITTDIEAPAPTKVPEIVPPAPTGAPEGIKAVFGDRPVPRAVRLAGGQDVFTIGEGGKFIESPEEFERMFGTREQAGIVGEITPEQAKLLNIRPEGVAELKATRQRDVDKKELFDLGQQAGLSFEEATSLVNQQFPVDTGKIREDLGISDVAEKLFTMPEKTIQETYQEAYVGSDLPDLKNRIKKIDDKIASRESDLVKATGELNNNPWLSQASRTGRLRILNELAFADIRNLENQRTSYMDLYDKGIDDLEGVMTRASDQLELQREMTAEQFNFLLGEAERIEDERLQGLTRENLRFAPEFLKERIADIKAEEDKLTTEEKIELGYILDATGKLVSPTLAPTGAKTGGSMSWRNNNPGNIKFGAFAEQYGAIKGAEATDGGNFAIFPDEATGQQAMVDLLQSPNYRDLTLDQAMKRWSNNGYGSEVFPRTMPKDLKMSEYAKDPQFMDELVKAMRKREGWTEGIEEEPSLTFPTDEDIENLTTDERNVMQGVMRLLPTKLKDALAEKKERQKEVIFSYRQGKTFQTIADEFQGFIIDPKISDIDRSLASSLRAMATGTDLDLRDISAPINLGDPVKAIINVENANLTEAQGELKEVSSSRALIKNANRVLDLLEKAPTNNLGAFDGKKFKVKKFAGLSDAEIQRTQQLETAMVNLLNEIRRKSLGTAVTESEVSFLEPLLTSLLDQPEIIQTKMNELKFGTINVHNEARGTVGLPIVNEEQILDNKLRLDLYRGEDSGITSSPDGLSDEEAYAEYQKLINL